MIKEMESDSKRAQGAQIAIAQGKRPGKDTEKRNAACSAAIGITSYPMSFT
jgi:hypothetical protein